MQRGIITAFVLAVLCAMAVAGEASDVDIEKEVQENLYKSRAIVYRVAVKIKSNEPVSSEIQQLKVLSENIQAAHLLLQERFRLREEAVQNLGTNAQDRHRVMEEGYLKALGDYLALIESLQQSALSSQLQTPQTQQTLQTLKTLLDKILPKKKRPIFGSLPYRNLNYPAREPDASPAIKPAYKGGNKTVNPEDTQSTEEAPITGEIASLAESLKWNPVQIYEYVKNNIETEWYWGCMKGAEETLYQKSGNDCDQAILFASLLRASGFPTRYIRGTIEFFPDMSSIKNNLGIDDPLKIAEFLQKAGIPYKPVIQGGKIANFQIERIWIESQIPYGNYRGAIIDDSDKTWLGLDTSIKVKDYVYNNPIDIFQQSGISSQLTAIRDEYLGAVQTQTPLEYLETKLTTGGYQLSDLMLTKTLVPETLKILPASMQFDQKKITHEYTGLPDELKHKVRFVASDPQSATPDPLFDITLNTMELSNRQIALSYEPETVEDQEIIDSYGGLDNTPAYLVRLRPVLKVDGEMVVAGRDGLPMGEDHELTIELISPNGTEKTTNTHITGNLTAIAITAQKAISDQQSAISEEDDAETILFKEANRYIGRWNQAEEELASLMHMAIVRPIPTVVTIGGVIDVTYLLDMPHGFEWKGVFVDAGLRAVSVQPSAVSTDDRQKTFMQLSALQGSILENRIFEDDFQVESISTAKLIQLCKQQSAGSCQVITIDRTNIAAVLPTLTLDDNIREDIINTVNQGFIVRIPQPLTPDPQSLITYEDWSGIGYIKENPSTGEAGYMLSGIIAGGMTAWRTDKWPEYYRDRLNNPNAEPPNNDPLAAIYIQKLPRTDLQFGKVGEMLGEPLSVMITDAKGKPVAGAAVLFTVKAGGGKIIDLKSFGIERDALTIYTDSTGVGRAFFKLGKETKTNPALFYLDTTTDKYPTQVGENIIEASLESKGITTPKPFTAYGVPQPPSVIKPLHGNGQAGPILTFSGFVSVDIEDEYGNPISNQKVVFTAQPAIQKSLCPDQDNRPLQLFRTTDPCLKNVPMWGECSAEMPLSETTTNKGAAVQTILGGTPNADYQITATSGKLSATFTQTALPFGNCEGTQRPGNQLMAEHVYKSDMNGGNIDAGKVDTTIPVSARVFYIREGENETDQTLQCDGGPLTCKTIVGSKRYTIDTAFSSATVSFGGQPGIPLGNGLYKASYILKPGINTIAINATATIGTRQSANSCSGGCKTSDNVPVTKDTGTTMTVYGVNIKLAPAPVIIVAEDGYTKQDYKITYTITPPEYTSFSAAVIIYKDNELIDYIPTETSASGFATLAKGYQFDITGKYEAEVVLNYGSGVEIRSDRTTLPVGIFKMVADDEPTATMQGAVTDGASRLRLQLIVKNSQAAFAGLRWSIDDSQLPGNLTGKGRLVIGNNTVSERPLDFNTDGIAEAVYEAPDSFVRWGTSEEANDKERAERLIQVMLGGQKDDMPFIRLKRPPVVLVHGLWGNAAAWDVFEPKINNKGAYDIFRVEYYEKNQVRSVADHAFRLGEKINDVIDKFEESGFAASKVDVIAHSMGGLLTREYCKQFDTECRSKIRRFITIATPHFGSELADLLVVYRDDRNHFPDLDLCRETVEKFIRGGKINIVGPLGKKIEAHPVGPVGGAIDDLATGRLPAFVESSTVGSLWSDPVYLPLSENFSAHTIIGLTSPAMMGIDLEVLGLWKFVLSRCGFTRANVFGPEADTNDRIVKQTSQEGGVLKKYSTQIFDADHFTVRNENKTIDQIRILLDEPKDSELFTK